MIRQIGITIITLSIFLPLFLVLRDYIYRKYYANYEIVTETINDVTNVDIKFKKQTTLTVSGDVDFYINGDMFFVNNGRLCILTKESIHLDSKKLFLQCRENPLLKKHRNIKREIEKSDAILIELEKQKEV